MFTGIFVSIPLSFSSNSLKKGGAVSGPIVLHGQLGHASLLRQYRVGKNQPSFKNNKHICAMTRSLTVSFFGKSGKRNKNNLIPITAG